MGEYGVWLSSSVDVEPGAAVLYGPDETPPEEPTAEAATFTWRGTAASRDEAVDRARAAWEERFGGPPERGTVQYVLEIEPGDAGYLGEPPPA